ncbi:MAG: phosphocholine cytidylyltransferase family protein [Desulfobacterales bacterium]|jgi:choline kinase
MKAVILSAGQGKRLLPLTKENPKCLLNIEGQSIIEWQIRELAKCGIERISVVAGYQFKRVKRLLEGHPISHQVHVVYNPTFSWADNLFSCWVARHEIGEDFVLLNGDTLFEAAVLKRLLATAVMPVTVMTHKKSYYDADDMKVSLNGDRLVDIGKKLPADSVDAESIGMILFREKGPLMFRSALENAMRDPAAYKQWYLSVIARMAGFMPVGTVSANGLQWCEVDFPADLKQAQKVVRTFSSSSPDRVDCQFRYAVG